MYVCVPVHTYIVCIILQYTYVHMHLCLCTTVCLCVKCTCNYVRICMCMHYNIHMTLYDTYCTYVCVCLSVHNMLMLYIHMYIRILSLSQIVKNTNGTLCNHYPSEIVVLKGEIGRKLSRK